MYLSLCLRPTDDRSHVVEQSLNGRTSQEDLRLQYFISFLLFLLVVVFMVRVCFSFLFCFSAVFLLYLDRPVSLSSNPNGKSSLIKPARGAYLF